MDSCYHGRPSTDYRVPVHGIHQVNGDPHNQYQKKQVNAYMSTPQNTSGAQTLSSPENKHLSAVQAREQSSPHSKRDSATPGASTNESNSKGRRKTHVGPWQLGRTIGQGGCSRVRLVRHSVTGQRGAAKIISKATAEKIRALSLANLIKSVEKEPGFDPYGKSIPFGLEREICIMKLLDHPNIVRLYDVWENRDEL